VKNLKSFNTMNAELEALYRSLINSPQRLQDEYNRKHSVLNTGELPATVTTRRKRKRAPAMATLSAKQDRKRRMKKRHWYEDKLGDLSKFVKKPRKKAKSQAKPPVCFNRRTTLLSLLKRIPAVKTPLAKMMG